MSEVRPIDANALGIYEIEVSKDIIKCNPDIKEIFAIFGAAIDRQPTLDYEPVVYCRNCKHRNKEYSETFCEVLGRLTNDNFYCRYGAKMDEEVKG